MTVQALLEEINAALDLPHGDLHAVTADRFAHGWRVMGPGVPTTNGLSEEAVHLLLTGMLAGVNATGERDRA